MKKVLNFLKRNIAIHMVVGAWLGVMGAVYVIYSNAEVSSGLNASSVNIDTTNMPLVGENKKLDEVLDYLYSKAALVGTCPEGSTCIKHITNEETCTSGYTCYETSTFIQNLQVGDLIKMIPPETKGQIDENRSGSSQGSNLDPSELVYWRVINKNANGTVDVVSEYVSSKSVYFYGIPGYANYVGYLNELASYYENPTYTIGSRMMGYGGQTQYISNNKSYFSGSYDSAISTTTTPSPTTGTGSEYYRGAYGDTFYLKDYNLVKNAYKGTTLEGTNGTVKAYKKGSTSITDYWLASRRFYYSSTTYFTFGGRYIDANGSLSSSSIRWYSGSNWGGSTENHPIRPILTLKSTITSSSTASVNINGTTTAYVLG